MHTAARARAPGGELGSQFASASQPTLAAVWRTPGAALAQLAALRPPKPAPARKAKPAAAGTCSPATPAPGLPAASEAHSPRLMPLTTRDRVTAADVLAAEGLSPVQPGQLAAPQTAGRGAAAASGAWADWPAGGSALPDEPAARGDAPGAAPGGAASCAWADWPAGGSALPDKRAARGNAPGAAPGRAASGAWADWPAGGSALPDEPAARGYAPGAAPGGAASGAWADWPAGGSAVPDEPAARGDAPGAAPGGAATEAGTSAAAGAAEAAHTTAGDACPRTLAAADPDPACARAALEGGSSAPGLRDGALAGSGVPRGPETPPWLGGGPPAGGATSPATAGGGVSLPRPQRTAAAPSRLRWPGGPAGAPWPDGGPEEPEEALARCAAAWLPRDLAVAEAYLRAQGAAEVRDPCHSQVRGVHHAYGLRLTAVVICMYHAAARLRLIYMHDLTCFVVQHGMLKFPVRAATAAPGCTAGPSSHGGQRAGGCAGVLRPGEVLTCVPICTTCRHPACPRMHRSAGTAGLHQQRDTGAGKE